MIHEGDCLAVLPTLEAESVDCCVTSPPYWGLRKYPGGDLVWDGDAGHEHEWGKQEKGRRKDILPSDESSAGRLGSDNRQTGMNDGGRFCSCGAWRGQLGLEPTPDLFIAHLTAIFSEVRRVLKPHGSMWVVIGDCYSSDSKWGGQSGGKNLTDGGVNRSRRSTGLKDKDLVGIPFMLAFALRADGWYWRHEGVWAKGVSFCTTYSGGSMPESVRDRPSRSHEAVLIFSKERRYFYDQKAAAEQASSAPQNRTGRVDRSAMPGAPPHRGLHARTNREGGRHGFNRELLNEKVGRSGNKERKDGHGGNQVGTSIPWEGTRRNLRSVWAINPEPFSAKEYGVHDVDHFASFPVALVTPMVKLSCPPGGTVLDPFMGTGCTGWVATQLGRSFIGIEMAAEYVEIARRRLAGGELFAAAQSGGSTA